MNQDFGHEPGDLRDIVAGALRAEFERVLPEVTDIKVTLLTAECDGMPKGHYVVEWTTPLGRRWGGCGKAQTAADFAAHLAPGVAVSWDVRPIPGLITR